MKRLFDLYVADAKSGQLPFSYDTAYTVWGEINHMFPEVNSLEFWEDINGFFENKFIELLGEDDIEYLMDLANLLTGFFQKVVELEFGDTLASAYFEAICEGWVYKLLDVINAPEDVFRWVN